LREYFMPMRFQMRNMIVVASWGSSERRSDGLASPEVKETPCSHKNHLFENEMISSAANLEFSLETCISRGKALGD
jgi:hypothetical protein